MALKHLTENDWKSHTFTRWQKLHSSNAIENLHSKLSKIRLKNNFCFESIRP